MTNTEAIRRLTDMQRTISIRTENDQRNFDALELALIALKTVKVMTTEMEKDLLGTTP